MDLIQVGGSLISIIILALITTKLFPNNSRLNADRVVRNVKRYCPDIEFVADDAQIFLSTDEMSAVLLFPDNNDGFALATAFGDRVVIRHVPSTDEFTVKTLPDGLSISLDDFTQPSVKLVLDEPTREALHAVLSSPIPAEGGAVHA